MFDNYIISIEIPWDSHLVNKLEEFIANLLGESRVLLAFRKQDPDCRLYCACIVTLGDPDFVELRIRKAYDGMPDRLRMSHEPISILGKKLGGKSIIRTKLKGKW